MKKILLVVIMLLFPAFVLASDTFVITIPLHQSWETGNFHFGYKVWLNHYQMIELEIENGKDEKRDCKYQWTKCKAFTVDLSEHNGYLEEECSIEQFSMALMYMPDETKKWIEIYEKNPKKECLYN